MTLVRDNYPLRRVEINAYCVIRHTSVLHPLTTYATESDTFIDSLSLFFLIVNRAAAIAKNLHVNTSIRRNIWKINYW